jgi:drug/metabolite transporter (DMT)-like permease
MKPITIAGILLIIVGVIGLAYQGIHYTQRENVLDVGSIHLTHDTEKQIPISPILGGLALAGGVALLVLGGRQKS